MSCHDRIDVSVPSSTTDVLVEHAFDSLKIGEYIHLQSEKSCQCPEGFDEDDRNAEIFK